MKKQKVELYWGIWIEWKEKSDGASWAWSMDGEGGLGAKIFFEHKSEAAAYQEKHWPIHSGIKSISVRSCFLPLPEPRREKK